MTGSTWSAPELTERLPLDPVFEQALHQLPEPSMIAQIGEHLLVQLMPDWCVVISRSRQCWNWSWLMELLPPYEGWTACVFERYRDAYLTHLFQP